LLQKMEALEFQIEAKRDEALEKNIAALVKKHGGPDVTDPDAYLRDKLDYAQTMAAVILSFPKSIRKIAMSRLLQANGTTRFERSGVKLLRAVRQIRYLAAQLIFAIAAIPIVGIAL
jgi:hypothetical protein